ncbi:hypothetical protein PR202_ga12699 [Eleusine coracana subsp. coracana]|uniref:Uncharacterized protein n=1 Tax=Eleusine coracana subsp. coracana TaxID=191504 RepID=A0AAV5CCU0_ELECO|nr:hypothetical protein PR202_ga12699 [Eleusine coracana subsp. coracana]
MAAACEGGGDGDRERGAASLHRRRQQGGRGQVQADLRSVRGSLACLATALSLYLDAIALICFIFLSCGTDPRWRVHRSGIVSLAHGWIQRQGSTRCELATEMVRVTRPPRQLRQDGDRCSCTQGVAQRTRLLLSHAGSCAADEDAALVACACGPGLEQPSRPLDVHAHDVEKASKKPAS